MTYYLSKNCKIQEGYGNTAIYNFNTKQVYLVNSSVVQSILAASLSSALAEKLCASGILTTDESLREQDPFGFDYSLFDDKYSYSKCSLAYLEITDVCNFHCVHCYANTKKDATSFMSAENVAFYLSQIRSLGPCDIRITGGEPFLNREIRNIVRTVHSTITPITKHSIVSNGSFHIDDALFALHLGFELQISIYGVDESKFCNFTSASPTAYQRVVKNLAALAKSIYKDQVVLLFSVNAITYKDIDAFIETAKSLGLRYILNRPASVGRAVTNWNLLRLPEEQLVAFAQSQRSKTPFYCYHLCQLHWTSIMVNGDVTPCGFLRDRQYVLGNLNQNTFAQIWQSKNYDSFRSLNPNNVKKCRKCEFKYICTAGCCGETAAYTGDILNPFSGCQIRPYVNNNYLHIADDELFHVIKNAAGLFDFKEMGRSGKQC